jgi:hypothetical protein
MQILSGLTQGQVLQRLSPKGAEVILTGTAKVAVDLRATVSSSRKPIKGWNKKKVGKVIRGKFSVKLSGIPAGGPYRLILEAGKERAEVTSFFVGDVWILAGQSNMEGIGRMTGRAKSHPLIRAFSMRREWRLAEDPLHVIPESPDTCHAIAPCSPERGEELRRTMKKGAGVGIFFAREMLERSGVPQGLVCTAHGGTSMNQWSPARKKLGGESLYASMLMSVAATGQPVSGVLWYQGESDANPVDGPEYTTRMKKLVEASRRDLKLPRLPWFIVQLARHFTDPAGPRGWNSVQEQQRLLPSKIKFLETVPAIDLPCDDGIHVGSAGFPRLALRLASAADRIVHGNKHEQRPPQLRGIREVGKSPDDYSIEVSYDNVPGGLQSHDEPSGFMFTSPEGTPRNLIYNISLHGDTAKLHIGMKPRGGVQLWYGQGYSPRCNITDGRGFALPVFGPVDIDRTAPKALTPFVYHWRVTGIIPTGKKLDQVDLPDMNALGATTKTYAPDGFINENPSWVGKRGQAFFHSRLNLSEPMKLEFLMGYDGPFRLWLDGKNFFTNMAGANPCFADESAKTVALSAGDHDIHIGMDLAEGSSWGFFLRFARKDVTRAQILSGEFVKPTASI